MTHARIAAVALVCASAAVTAFGQERPAIDISRLSNGQPSFPLVWQPYRSPKLPPVDLRNGADLDRLADGGSLRLSLSEFLRLVAQNDLTLEAARYDFAIAQVDVLRAKSGQAARGIAAAPLPGSIVFAPRLRCNSRWSC